MAAVANTLDFDIRHRLVGAVVLLTLGVIFIPIILQGQGPGATNGNSEFNSDVQELILDAEEAETYVSRIVPVDESGEQNKTNDTNLKQSLPKLKVIDDPNSTANTVKPTPESIEQSKIKEKNREIILKLAKTLPKDIEKGWVVQIGTFSKPQNAQNLINKLSQSGVEAKYELINTNQGQSTRVWVGPFEDRSFSEQVLDSIKDITGVKGFIKSYPN